MRPRQTGRAALPQVLLRRLLHDDPPAPDEPGGAPGEPEGPQGCRPERGIAVEPFLS